jgi:hypothetical protein
LEISSFSNLIAPVTLSNMRARRRSCRKFKPVAAEAWPLMITPSWYVFLEGSQNDTVALKQHFMTAGFSFDEIDGKNLLWQGRNLKLAPSATTIA